jgi:hypothetical protein
LFVFVVCNCFRREQQTNLGSLDRGSAEEIFLEQKNDSLEQHQSG